jgi:hypothetical protein
MCTPYRRVTYGTPSGPWRGPPRSSLADKLSACILSHSLASIFLAASLVVPNFPSPASLRQIFNSSIIIYQSHAYESHYFQEPFIQLSSLRRQLVSSHYCSCPNHSQAAFFFPVIINSTLSRGPTPFAVSAHPLSLGSNPIFATCTPTVRLFYLTWSAFLPC